MQILLADVIKIRSYVFGKRDQKRREEFETILKKYGITEEEAKMIAMKIGRSEKRGDGYRVVPIGNNRIGIMVECPLCGSEGKLLKKGNTLVVTHGRYRCTFSSASPFWRRLMEIYNEAKSVR